MDHISEYKHRIHIPCRKTNTSGVVVDESEWVSPEYVLKSWRLTSPKGYKDYKSRLQKGISATTTMNAGRRSLNLAYNGFCDNILGGNPLSRNITWGPRQIVGTGDIPFGTIETFDDNLYYQARDEAYQNLVKSYRSATQQMQSGVFLGELAEAVRFLKSPCKRLANLSTRHFKELGQDLRRIARGGGTLKDRNSSALRAATDAHLAYTYAAKPLVNDIAAADSALRYYDEVRSPMIRITGNGKAESAVSTTKNANSFTSVDGGIYGAATNAKYTRDVTKRITVRYLGAYKASNSTGLPSPMEQMSLTPDNWAPTIYELAPWSFVLDYFSNVGKVIDAFSFQMVDLAWLNETRRQYVTYLISDLHSVNANTICYGGHIRDNHTLLIRQRTSNSVVPSFRFKLPGLGQDLNLAALANSLLPFQGHL